MIKLTEDERNWLNDAVEDAHRKGIKFHISIERPDLISGSISVNYKDSHIELERILNGGYVEQPPRGLSDIRLEELFLWENMYASDSNGWICLFDPDDASESGRWFLHIDTDEHLTLFRKEINLERICSFELDRLPFSMALKDTDLLDGSEYHLTITSYIGGDNSTSQPEECGSFECCLPAKLRNIQTDIDSILGPYSRLVCDLCIDVITGIRNGGHRVEHN